MSFKIENDTILVEYNEIWKSIKKVLDMKFHSKAIYDEKYIKAKVKTFNEVLNTVFSDNKIPKKNGHYTCKAAKSIDSVMRIDKKTTFKSI